jgi:hypothetical protein
LIKEIYTEMKVALRLLALLALLSSSMMMQGCFTATEDDSSIPWSRPASWENSAPGMPGFGGFGG